MEAIVLAGGLGTRLRSVVPDLPKPLALVNGRPFLCYLLDFWIEQGVTRFVVSVGYKREAIQGYFGSSYKSADVAYAIEEEALGTGGGVIRALPLLRTEETFLVLNGDTFFAITLADLVRLHKETKADMTMSLVEVSANTRYSGVQLDDKGFVVSLEKRTGHSDNRVANGGVYLIERKTLSDFESQPIKKTSLEDELIPVLLHGNKRIFGFTSSGSFLDIGIPEDYNRAAELLAPYA